MARKGDPHVRRLGPDDPGLVHYARLRHDAFLEDSGLTRAESLAQVVAIAGSDTFEAAYVVEVGGTPAGLCMLVADEISPRHVRTPWLASLIVAPQFRRRGFGAILVGAVEDHARTHGFARLYLYSGTAEAYYARLGWETEDRFGWDGEPFVLMRRSV